MKDKEIIADFQFLGNRVDKFVLDTKLIEEKGRSSIAFDFDYEVVEVAEDNGEVPTEAPADSNFDY